jgi:death on curing protein
MIEPKFLTLDEVLDLHEEQILFYGGTLGVRDMGLVESAAMMPAATFGGEFLHADIFVMAAAYAFHIAENQAFVDGNKRAGIAAAFAFLGLNGYAVNKADDELYKAMIAISAREMDKEGFGLVLKRLSLPIDMPL